MDLALFLLCLHLAVTAFMTGLIWFVQVVHYPLFARVDAAGFGAYARSHQTLTTWVVGPAMLVEVALALWVVVGAASRVPPALAWAGLALLVIIWLSTAVWQVPRHRELSNRFDLESHRRLVRTNWVRTVAWSLRSVLSVAMIGAAEMSR